MIILDERCNYRDLLSLVYGEMVNFGGREGLGLRLDDRGLYLLRHRGDLAVVFIEVAFMTNPYDMRLLTQPEGNFKRNIMHGVAVGILRYFTGKFTPLPSIPAKPLGFDSSIFCLVDEEGLIENGG
jgi:hypothetical protein